MEAIGGRTSNLFLLPEFVSSFLLGRNIELEFRGLDQDHTSSALKVFSGVHFAATYMGIGIGASLGLKKDKEQVVAGRTTNGVKITVPGAQILGYYTNIVPQFPSTQDYS